MRSIVVAGLLAGLCALLCAAVPAAALELNTVIDLDYNYDQENVADDVNAATQFSQKYELKYATSLTTAYDFIGAVRVELEDAWFTDEASTSLLSPTLEMQAKSSMATGKFTYEVKLGSTDAFRDAGEINTYSTNMAFDAEMIIPVWPELKLKVQRRTDLEEYSKESTQNTIEFSARKDIYALRLEYNFVREVTENDLPERGGSVDTQWAAKATYKEVLWGGTEFEAAYEIKEDYGDEETRGVFTGESSTYSQNFRSRVKNSLVLNPRMTVGLSWEYQYDEDLLSLEYDYKLQNKYLIDLRWDAFDWLKITGEAQRETTLTAAVPGQEDERVLNDALKAGFDLTSISWLRVSGKAEFQSGDTVRPGSGGSIDRKDDEKYELIVKHTIGEFWEFTWDATAASTHTDDLLTNRETRVKADLKLKFGDLIVTPGYEVSRANEWERKFDFPMSQQQIRDAKIKFEYKAQLADLVQATFSHEYDMKADDTLDEVLNFERVIQFNEETRLNVALNEIIRGLRLEGEVDRKASDTEGDMDEQLIDVSYSLKLDWKFELLTLLSTLKYNDKGDTFDDVTFNAKATWKYEQVEVSGEYQFEKVIKDVTEPKDEKRKLNLKLNYKF